jgi:ABC-type dipeptide/oligopeptide/nickel transport system permease component
MFQYIVKRLIHLLFILLGISVITFSMIHLIPGDPAQVLAGIDAEEEDVQALRVALGLDKPLYKQYFDYMWRALHGDLGRSLQTRREVILEIKERFPNTVQLAFTSVIIATILGVPAGIIAASRNHSFFDYVSMVFAVFGVSTPVFWLGLMLMLLFAVKLDWLPTTGKEGLKHLVLPALTLGFAATAFIARMTRSCMLEVLALDYIRTARSKGLREFWVICKHALCNAMLPIITVIGLQFGTLLAGAITTEIVFAWPGIGRLVVDAVNYRDFPVIQGTVWVVATAFVLINLAVDIIYTFLDPKITH